jgi:hypothetical protein
MEFRDLCSGWLFTDLICLFLKYLQLTAHTRLDRYSLACVGYGPSCREFSGLGVTKVHSSPLPYVVLQP